MGKREQILAAVEQACEGKRLHEVTVDDIASLAGVGKGTIYRYFADKEDLFFSLMILGFDRMAQDVAACGRLPCPFEEKLTEACTRMTGFFRSRHAVARMFGEQEEIFRFLTKTRKEVFDEHKQRLRAVVCVLLEEGRECGDIRRDIDTDTLARFLLGMLFVRDHKFEDCAQLPTIEMVIDLFLRGVCRAAGANVERALS